MIDLAQILALPPDKRDDEIQKLLPRKPGKHRWKRNHFIGEDRFCLKCKQWLNPKLKTVCPIPDRIDLDFNLAMKMYREAEKKYADINWKMAEVCNAAKGYVLAPCEAHAPTTMVWIWFCTQAQPCHYLLAAILAKEKDGT